MFGRLGRNDRLYPKGVAHASPLAWFVFIKNVRIHGESGASLARNDRSTTKKVFAQGKHLFYQCISKIQLAEDLGNDSRTNSSAAFADSELKLFFNSYGLDELDRDGYMVAGHYHFGACGKLDRAGNIGSSDEELRAIVVEEGGVTAAFVSLKNVDLSLELGSRFNGAGLSENLALFDALTIDTTEKCADVEACDSFVNALVEHFETGDDGADGLVDEAYDLGGIANVSYAPLYTAGSNGATTGDGEYVLDGKKEGLIGVALRSGDVLVDGVHELEDALALGSGKNFCVGVFPTPSFIFVTIVVCCLKNNYTI